jgi:hypothetical protein
MPTLATKTTIVAEFTNRAPDCPSLTASTYFDLAIEEISRELDLFNLTASLRLTADTFQYNLTSAAAAPWYELGSTSTKATEGMWVIKTAVYRATETEHHDLTAVSEDDIIAMFGQHWRLNDSGTPRYIFINGSEAGATSVMLYPTPDTSSDPTDGEGFPRVDISGTKIPASAITGLPVGLRSMKPVYHRMLYHWFTRQGREDLAALQEEKYEKELHEARLSLRQILRLNQPGFVYRPNRRGLV